MNTRPLADCVLTELAVVEERALGGTTIPDLAKEEPLKGEIVVVGNGTKDEEVVVKVGDNILCGKYVGMEIELDGEKYLIVHQVDVLAVI